jgi:hypothetical protein
LSVAIQLAPIKTEPAPRDRDGPRQVVRLAATSAGLADNSQRGWRGQRTPLTFVNPSAATGGTCSVFTITGQWPESPVGYS